MSDYHAFCQRNAARFAGERAAETPDETPPPRKQSKAASALTDAMVSRMVDAKIENAFCASATLRELIAEVLVLEREAMRAHVAQELGALKAEVEILRSVVKSTNIQLVRKTKNVA